jgi:ADP-ribose pyrophosphatase YjhB (NUDIX family)
MREETRLELVNLRQFHVYSQPDRDPRGHCVSVVFTARGRGFARAGDDAADVRLVDPAKLGRARLAFDHRQILADYAASIGSARRRNQAG